MLQRGKLDLGSQTESTGERRNGAHWLHCFSLSFSVTFLIQPSSTCPGMAPTTVDWALPYELEIKKSRTDVSDGDNISVEGLLSQTCQVDKTNQYIS